MKVRLLEQNYQRNGVTGEGFYVVKCEITEYRQTGILIATFTDPNGNNRINQTTCRVINPTDLQKCYRGDELAFSLQNEYNKLLVKHTKLSIYDLEEIINKHAEHFSPSYDEMMNH